MTWLGSTAPPASILQTFFCSLMLKKRCVDTPSSAEDFKNVARNISMHLRETVFKGKIRSIVFMPLAEICHCTKAAHSLRISVIRDDKSAVTTPALQIYLLGPAWSHNSHCFFITWDPVCLDQLCSAEVGVHSSHKAIISAILMMPPRKTETEEQMKTIVFVLLKCDEPLETLNLVI